MNTNTEVAVYYFPNYHIDERNEACHGNGWTEWELVKAATPRFAGHEQPKIPLWGYEDESDPVVMARKIETAANHGISSFIFDWYWYGNQPYLHKALEQGFLPAADNGKLKFALMWANHDWVDIHPALRNGPYNTLMEGTVTEKEFVDATDYIIAKYFSRDSYWRVEGGLYFSFYELMNLIKGFGGSMEETRRILDGFRERTRQAGYGEIHLNAVVWGIGNLPGEKKIEDVNGLVETLGFDSITSYVWIHHREIPSFPSYPYSRYRKLCEEDYEKFTGEYRLPYFPNVSMGWDPTPRTIQTDRYDNDKLGYPYTPVLQGNTPEEFREALLAAKRFLDQGRTKPNILTVNSWNEWTEGSYLEPDTRYGLAYLEAIQQTFGRME